MSAAERGVATPPAPPTAPSAWDRRDRRVAVLLFLVVLVVYLATATYTNAQTNDTRSAAIAAWSITHRSELALPDWRAENANYWRVTGQDGRSYSNRFRASSPGASRSTRRIGWSPDRTSHPTRTW